MKFKFCSEGDCPLWALAALHATSGLSAPQFRSLLDCVVSGQNEDAIMEILKETRLSSRDECARAAAVLRWTLQQAWSSSCSGRQLSRDLMVLGVPRAHAAALAEKADDHRKQYEDGVREKGFMVNKVTEGTATRVAEGPSDVIKLSLITDDVFTGDQSHSEVLLDAIQAKTLLEELNTAYRHMEELGVETGEL